MRVAVAPSAKDLVQTVLDTLSIFVMPDWKAIIAVLPFVLAVLFIAWFAFTVRKFATLGPRRRAPARIQPITPPAVHMPGGSAAPILVAQASSVISTRLRGEPNAYNVIDIEAGKIAIRVREWHDGKWMTRERAMAEA